MNEYLPFKAGTRTVLDSLLSEYQWLEFLKNKNKPYEPLLDHLISMGKFESLSEENYDNSNRHIKDISIKSGINASKVSKWISKIYDDLIELNWNTPQLFKKAGYIHHVFSFSTLYGYFYGINLWLPCRVQTDDFMTFSFIRAKVNSYNFYAERVSFEHQYGEVIIQVDLKFGWIYNRYRQLLIDKLYFTKELSIEDIFNKNSFDLDKKLLGKANRSNDLL